MGQFPHLPGNRRTMRRIHARDIKITLYTPTDRKKFLRRSRAFASSERKVTQSDFSYSEFCSVGEFRLHFGCGYSAV